MQPSAVGPPRRRPPPQCRPDFGGTCPTSGRDLLPSATETTPDRSKPPQVQVAAAPKYVSKLAPDSSLGIHSGPEVVEIVQNLVTAVADSWLGLWESVLGPRGSGLVWVAVSLGERRRGASGSGASSGAGLGIGAVCGSRAAPHVPQEPFEYQHVAEFDPELPGSVGVLNPAMVWAFSRPVEDMVPRKREATPGQGSERSLREQIERDVQFLQQAAGRDRHVAV